MHLFLYYRRLRMSTLILSIESPSIHGELLTCLSLFFFPDLKQNKKVKVIAVGIGSGINERELRQISSNHVFQVKDYASLSKNLKNILDASCP